MELYLIHTKFGKENNNGIERSVFRYGVKRLVIDVYGEVESANDG